MTLEQIDRYCDLFEQRLQQGERISADDFLAEHQLSVEARFLEEFRELEREYRRRRVQSRSAVANESTVLVPGGSSESRIGNYKLLQKIGEGGMGVVYMAEQLHPVSRRVAVKVIKPGMDSKEVLARFESERQALALMDHPNIARVFDAGTTDSGLPYFVMELVKGVPMTTYCDDKQLSPTERLELFIPICQAVQHAHQKGVIHRDLKPTNILIAQYDNRPVPKIIDFGLAKATSQRLTEKTMFTQFGQIVGTIDYMSPEQASFNQLDVDTRSDVYSLGVLLYELLTGETPFDKQRLHTAAIDEMLRIIRQEEPPRPSVRLSSNASLPSTEAKRRLEIRKLCLLIRGELDWIVMKAIDKERDRRYQSAGALADDIQNYLTHDTVQACPPSPAYLFQKFARRNRALITTAALVFAALLAGLTGTSWALVRATKAEGDLEMQVAHLDRQNRQLLAQLKAKVFLAAKLRQFDRLSAAWINQQMGQISRDSNPSSPELRQSLLDHGIDFWNQLIATDYDPDGNRDPRHTDHRLQLALCLARAGKYELAFQEAQALRKARSRTGQWADELVRTFALCASAAAREPKLADAYAAEALQVLTQAAIDPESPPPLADDPDLAALAARPDFAPALHEWDRNWSRYLKAKPINRTP